MLEAAGIPEPLFVNGVQQRPVEGVSMAYSFDDALAPERHQTQYFEMFGNRGIYHQGWTAVTRHRIPWEFAQTKLPAFVDDVWEFYDTNQDWSQARDVAPEHPQKLYELQRLWLIEADKHNVLPLDDRAEERANPDMAGRPQLVKGNRQRLFGGMGRLTEGSVVNTKNKTHAVTAEIEVPESGASGVIVAIGGVTGGWSLYAKDGKVRYCYNFYGLHRYTVESATRISSGTHQVRMEFDYDGDGIANGGTVTLYVDGQPDGEGRVEQTEPFVFSADETLDVGDEFGSPVTRDYASPKRFNGQVNWVEIDVDEAAQDADHFLSPDERLRLIVGLQ